MPVDLNKSPYHGQASAPLADDHHGSHTSATSTQGRPTPPRTQASRGASRSSVASARQGASTPLRSSTKQSGRPANHAEHAHAASTPLPTYTSTSTHSLEDKAPRPLASVPRAPAALGPPAPVSHAAAGQGVAAAATDKVSKPSMLSRLRTSLRGLSSPQHAFVRGCIFGAAGMLVLGLMSSNPVLLAMGITLMAAGLVAYMMIDPHAKPIPPVAGKQPSSAAATPTTHVPDDHRRADAASVTASDDSGQSALTAENLAKVDRTDHSDDSKRASILEWDRQSAASQRLADEQVNDRDSHRAQRAAGEGAAPSQPPASTVGSAAVDAPAAASPATAGQTPSPPPGYASDEQSPSPPRQPFASV